MRNKSSSLIRRVVSRNLSHGKVKRRSRQSIKSEGRTRPGDCIHIGPIIERTNADGKPCQCEGKWLRQCDERGQCRINETWDGADCQSCAQYWSRSNPNDPPEFAATRHLLYFICPLAGNGVWQNNVSQLLKRIDLFTGKRVIAIVTGNTRRPGMRPQILDKPEAVQSAFAGHGCEFVTMPNNKALGEVVAWPTLWPHVLPGGSGDVTFYAHAKGVNRPKHSPTHRWTEIMYETMLDHWKLIRESLILHPVICTFKKIGFCFPGTSSTWHPHGTFAWVRNVDMAARKWQAVPQLWGGTEAVWGMLFRPEESAGLLHAAHGQTLNCYSVDYMTRVIEPQYLKWKEKHGDNRAQNDERISGEAVQA